MKKRVVITGMGIVSPIGLSLKENWENLLSGKSGIAPVTLFDASAEATRFAGEVKGFDSSNYMEERDARRCDRFIHFGIASGIQAMEMANLSASTTGVDYRRFGVAMGSGIGGLSMIQDNHLKYLDGGQRKISPFFIAGSIINMIGGNLSIRYGLKGPNIAIGTACSTATHMIGVAARLIAYGDADIMLAGGAEAPISPLGLGGFNACRALSTRNDSPEKASRPWDKDRDGFVLAEGAATLVLESYECAVKRGAPILAELVGFGMSADAHHITAPSEDGEGAFNAMDQAVLDANIDVSDIGYINAHGTSTPLGDMIELLAIERLFAHCLDKAKHTAISSSKSMTGHLLGAAGAVEAVYTVMSLLNQEVPPTINLDNPENTFWNLVAHRSQKCSFEYAMSNSFGFGGTNGSLIFKRWAA